MLATTEYARTTGTGFKGFYPLWQSLDSRHLNACLQTCNHLRLRAMLLKWRSAHEETAFIKTQGSAVWNPHEMQTCAAMPQSATLSWRPYAPCNGGNELCNCPSHGLHRLLNQPLLQGGLDLLVGSRRQATPVAPQVLSQQHPRQLPHLRHQLCIKTAAMGCNALIVLALVSWCV